MTAEALHPGPPATSAPGATQAAATQEERRPGGGFTLPPAHITQEFEGVGTIVAVCDVWECRWTAVVHIQDLGMDPAGAMDAAAELGRQHQLAAERERRQHSGARIR